MKKYIIDVFKDAFDIVKETFYEFPRLFLVFIITETIVLAPLFLLKWLICGG